MKKIILIIASLLIACNILFATDKYAGESLNLGLGVKSMSMGNAFVAVADDPNAIYWNSAGLIQNNITINLSLMHSEQYAGVLKYDSFALSYPMHDEAVLGLLISRIGVGDIYFTELEDPNDTLSSQNPPIIESSENYSDFTTYLSYSSKFNEKISWGLVTKIIYKKIGNISATGLGLDAGIMAHVNNNLRFGVNLRDIFGTRIWWKDSDNNIVKTNILAGIAFDFEMPILKKSAVFSLQSDIFFEDREKSAQLHYKTLSSDFHAGLDLKLAEFISLSTGIEKNDFTAGIEITYDRYKLNYGFYSQPEIDNSHRLSLGINLNKELIQ